MVVGGICITYYCRVIEPEVTWGQRRWLHIGYLAGGELSHEDVDHVECFINLCPRPNSVGF